MMLECLFLAWKMLWLRICSLFYRHCDRYECRILNGKKFKSNIHIAINAMIRVKKGGRVYFTAKILVATDQLELLCCQTKIRSRGVATSQVDLIVWSTMNGMCAKNKCKCVVRASNNKRYCDAWSLLLLAVAVRSLAHVPLKISDHNKMVL